MAAPRSAPSSRARPSGARAATAARTGPALSPREVEALRRFLAGSEAFAATGSPRGASAVPTGTARATAVRRATTAPASRTTAPRATAPRTAAPGTAASVRTATARTSPGRSGAPAIAGGRPAARPVRPVRRPVRPSSARARRAARAARRRELLQTGRRWTVRGLRLTACALAAPLVAGVLLPGPSVRPAQGTPDATALALTARTTLLQGADTYRRLQAEVVRRQSDLQQAVTVEQAARAALSAQQQAVGRSAAVLYTVGPQQRYTVSGAESAAGSPAQPTLLGALRGTEQPRAVVREAERRVAEARSAVTAASARATTALGEVRGRAAALGTEVTGTLAGLGVAPGRQQARDQQALARWQAYLRQLSEGGIEPPPAAAITDLDHLPAGMSPALDRSGQPVPGVVWAAVGNTPVTVVPAETVAAVSAALSQLGKPFAPGAAGPDGYDCGGFTASSWLLAGYALAGTPQQQWADGAAVAATDLQPGDLVFSPGGQDVGLYLGNGDVLGASAATRRVAVRSLQPGATGVRVTLPKPAHPNAPRFGTLEGYCGAPAGRTNPAWGGFANGQIPRAALEPLDTVGHFLRPDAATAFRAMSSAYAAVFGSPICYTDSYRSYGNQVEAFREKPALAAWPGTSNHGWGLAVDLCGGINAVGTPEWTWMQANAARFGWLNPMWARPGGEKPEPWHWEFGNFG